MAASIPLKLFYYNDNIPVNPPDLPASLNPLHMKEFLATVKHYRVPDLVQDWLESPKVVLVHKKPAPDEQAFLEKMTAAFQWKPEEILQVHHPAETAVNYQLLWAKPALKLVLLFGMPPAEIGIHIQARPYQLAPCHPFHLYFVDSLDQVARSREMKAKLWNDLQKIDLG